MIPRATRPMKVGRGVVLVSIELLLPLPCKPLWIRWCRSLVVAIAPMTAALLNARRSAPNSWPLPPNLKPSSHLL